jgi:hypothetical protein
VSKVSGGKADKLRREANASAHAEELKRIGAVDQAKAGTPATAARSALKRPDDTRALMDSLEATNELPG